jgi:hypothetical protein
VTLAVSLLACPPHALAEVRLPPIDNGAPRSSRRAARGSTRGRLFRRIQAVRHATLLA